PLIRPAPLAHMWPSFLTRSLPDFTGRNCVSRNEFLDCFGGDSHSAPAVHARKFSPPKPGANRTYLEAKRLRRLPHCDQFSSTYFCWCHKLWSSSGRDHDSRRNTAIGGFWVDFGWILGGLVRTNPLLA